MKPERQDASFETILPALGSGKYDVGTGNFGVTSERLKTIDFVTYINDGQGFAVRKGSTVLEEGRRPHPAVRADHRHRRGHDVRGDPHRTEGRVREGGQGAVRRQGLLGERGVTTALQQGRIDVLMSTINGLRHQAAQPAAQTTFLGEYHRLDVGFAFKKGSPLTKAFQAAVNELIKDGTYARILAKWGTAASAIDASQINPAEHR